MQGRTGTISSSLSLGRFISSMTRSRALRTDSKSILSSSIFLFPGVLKRGRIGDKAGRRGKNSIYYFEAVFFKGFAAGGIINNQIGILRRESFSCTIGSDEDIIEIFFL